MKKIRQISGITMVEMMVIVVIIGVISAMAIPRFKITIERLKFKSATKEMLSTMRLARSNAITQKQPFGVNFDADSKTVTLFQDIINQSSQSFESGDSVISVDSLPEECALLATTFGSQTLIYRPNGSASASGYVWLISYTTDDDIHFGLINILASTGRTKIDAIHYY
ncbi:MAG: GspH/FimT family pseudopilin [candidate division Zixibacteria bacterium]